MTDASQTATSGSSPESPKALGEDSPYYHWWITAVLNCKIDVCASNSRDLNNASVQFSVRAFCSPFVQIRSRSQNAEEDKS